MPYDTILTLGGDRETTAAATAGRLREQITLLSAELDRIDRELAALATTRTTLQLSTSLVRQSYHRSCTSAS